MKDQPFPFYATQMTVRLTTPETGGGYALMEMRHPPGVGPALHVHPRSAESFYVLDGRYKFFRDEETVEASPGMAVTIPAGVPHRYVSGPDGGRILVMTPPGLEEYFWTVSKLLQKGPVSMDEEFAIAARLGQEFLDGHGHWGGHAAPIS
ncbi:MAG TPA: cupin domain-containing protein [Thermoanaerobaculia bacterium]|jgi:quercetin dioxygenase-like cupin family protein